MEFKQLIPVLVLIALADSKKTKPLEVKFLSTSFDGNPKYVKEWNFNITPNSNGQAFDLEARLLTKIVKDFYMLFDLLRKSNQKEDYHQLLSHDLNMCRIMDGFMSQTVARLWAQNMNKYSNIPLGCPIAPALYFVKKMKIDRKSIPMLASNGIYMFKAQVYIKNKSLKEYVTNSSMEVEINL